MQFYGSHPIRGLAFLGGRTPNGGSTNGVAPGKP